MMNLQHASAKSVLVVEDERVMSDVIRFNLQRAGYDVSVARNGVEAWDYLQSRICDLMVTDFQMPRMTGVDLCRKLRAEFPDWPLPVILLSARGLELNAAMLREEFGIGTLLFKPFSPRELVQVVSTLLAKTPEPVTSTAPSLE